MSVRIELFQDGSMVAAAEGPKADAILEMRHYAMLYSQEGPVEIRVKRGNVDLREIFAPSADGGR